MSPQNFDPELRNKAILCAADQAPFNVHGNLFCVLVPLLTESGKLFESVDLSAQFPNRGRIWWMLRSGIDPDLVHPGTLFTVLLEEALDYRSDRREKDFYQAQRETVQPGSRRFLEVLQFAREPDLYRALSDGVPWPRPTMGRIVLGGPHSLLGPFHATWDGGTRRVKLRAPNTEFKVWRAQRTGTLAGAVQEFRYPANAYDPRVEDEILEVAVLHEVHLGALAEGEELDALDDVQLANWALGHLGAGGSDRRRLKEFLKSVDGLVVEDEVARRRMARFTELCHSAERVAEFGDDAARMVAENMEGFEALVVQRIDAVAAERIAVEMEQRRRQLAADLAEEEHQLARLRAEVEGSEETRARKLREQEAELEREHAALIARLEAREQAVSEAEDRLEERRRSVEAGLEKLVARYEAESARVVEDALAQWPIFHRLTTGPGSGDAAAGRAGPVGKLRLPAFLERERETADTDEVGFLKQFDRVARHHGFHFAVEDLANFHIAVKTGIWTVLAGASGTGKSTLPRLYAETLGVLDELHWVAVRPDWMDDRDVIGGFNALTGRFEPAPCGIVDRLIAALEDERRGRGGIYLICLDEMNLSRVEHYFARFLSVMERPGADRVLNLFASGVATPEDPYGPYRRLRVPENVRFIGTVNVDETTHFFGPKVVDRSSLLILDRQELDWALSRAEDRSPAGGVTGVGRATYESWIRGHEVADESARSAVLELARDLREHGVDLGNRAPKRILRYVASAPGLLPQDRALDFAVAQVVLPRLRTSVPEYLAMLEALSKRFPAERYPRSHRLLETLREGEGDLDFFQVV